MQIPLGPLLTCLDTESDDLYLYYIVRTLGARGRDEQIPLESILTLFDREDVELRASVIRILARFGVHAPVDLLTATLGDSEQLVREAAAEALKQTHPEALHAIASEAISFLQRQTSGFPFDSVAHAFFADIVTDMGYASPAVFERLTELLAWPYWQVRVKAIRAFGLYGAAFPIRPYDASWNCGMTHNHVRCAKRPMKCLRKSFLSKPGSRMIDNVSKHISIGMKMREG